MAFRPRMETEISGFSVIGGPRTRVWEGVVADLWDVRCSPIAGGHYVGKDPRLVFMLDVQADAGGRFVMQHRKRGEHRFSMAERISYVPADEQPLGVGGDILVRDVDGSARAHGASLRDRPPR